MSPAILCLRFVAAPALVALLAGVASAQTVNNFEVAGTPYAEAHSNVAPVVLAGGPTGNFLRLASTPAVNIGTVAFARTDSVVNQVTADFDFRIIPPPAGRNQAADGMGFALLNTSVAGFETGPRWDGVPEWARFPGAIGVGFRIFNMNAVSIAFDGTERTLVSIPTATVDLASGQFIHAHIVFRPGGGHSDVTVTLTPSGGSPVTVIDRFVVSGVKPYPARVWFGARSGGLSADHDLDNVNVQFTGPTWDMPFVQLLKEPGMRFVSYSPTNFNPDATPQELPPADSITQDLALLRPLFNGLILYGTQNDLLDSGKQFSAWIVAEARRLKYRAIVLGVWDPTSDAEVTAAAALINQYATQPEVFAIALCLGNEGLLRSQTGAPGPKYGIAELDAARDSLLSKIGSVQIPIVTSEDSFRYDVVQGLRSWGTFLFPILVPHWNQPSIAAPFGPTTAAAWVRQRGTALAEATFLPTLVKEAAWPSGGSSGNDQVPAYTPGSQQQFFDAYFSGPSFVMSPAIAGVFIAFTTVLEAFDQPWKDSPDFTTWGLFTPDRSPKAAVQTFATFTDDPLSALVTPIRAEHVSELRVRIDTMRARRGLPAYMWTDDPLVPGLTAIRAQHVNDLRTALEAVYVEAGQLPPMYSDTIGPGSTIKASHISELRAAIISIE